MVKKRFEAHIFDDGKNERYYDGIIDNEKNNKVIVNYQYISTLLNGFYEEIHELKKDRNELFIRERDAKNDWRELKQENKQLKRRLMIAEDKIKGLMK